MLRFMGDGDQKKFTKNPRHFSMQNSQASSQKNPQKFSGERASNFLSIFVPFLSFWGLHFSGTFPISSGIFTIGPFPPQSMYCIKSAGH